MCGIVQETLGMCAAMLGCVLVVCLHLLSVLLSQVESAGVRLEESLMNKNASPANLAASSMVAVVIMEPMVISDAADVKLGKIK